MLALYLYTIYTNVELFIIDLLSHIKIIGQKNGDAKYQRENKMYEMKHAKSSKRSNYIKMHLKLAK